MPSRAQTRVSLERLIDEVQIGVQQCLTLSPPQVEPIGVKGTPNGIGMQPELSRYCSDFPMFGMEQSANYSNLLDRNHQLTSDRMD